MNLLIEKPEMRDAPEVNEIPAEKIMVEFLRPSQLKSFVPPEGFNLVGEYHVQKGAPFVIGGAPGVGKSRAAVALAYSGATALSWFGLKVHRKFKTMILQCENGRVRLKNEFADLDCETLDAYVRICPPPPFGFAFDSVAFREQLRKEIEAFKPDVIILDPFNRLARDDKAKDYMEAFNAVLSVIPNSDEVALGIVAHTRKPKADERANGRNALNMLAGSYVLASVPRSAFVMQSASEMKLRKIELFGFVAKNNDGELGSPTVWERGNGIFRPIDDFDWNEFNSPSENRKTVTEIDLAEIFGHGKIQLAKKQAVEKLVEKSRCGKSAAYNALGRFKNCLGETENGLLFFKK